MCKPRESWVTWKTLTVNQVGIANVRNVKGDTALPSFRLDMLVRPPTSVATMQTIALGKAMGLPPAMKYRLVELRPVVFGPVTVAQLAFFEALFRWDARGCSQVSYCAGGYAGATTGSNTKGPVSCYGGNVDFEFDAGEDCAVTGAVIAANIGANTQVLDGLASFVGRITW